MEIMPSITSQPKHQCSIVSQLLSSCGTSINANTAVTITELQRTAIEYLLLSFSKHACAGQGVEQCLYIGRSTYK